MLQGACVLGINAEPVTIKKIECTIIDYGFEQGWITPQVHQHLSGLPLKELCTKGRREDLKDLQM